MAFDLEDFLPYRLHQAAERASLNFRKAYQRKYGITRPEWRVLFNVGQYGPISAVGLSARSFLHKTKISRAAAKLEKRRWLKRIDDPQDRRSHTLALTPAGRRAFNDLRSMADAYNRSLAAMIGEDAFLALIDQLRAIDDAEELRS